jgi:hypothetical protein
MMESGRQLALDADSFVELMKINVLLCHRTPYDGCHSTSNGVRTNEYAMAIEACTIDC